MGSINRITHTEDPSLTFPELFSSKQVDSHQLPYLDSAAVSPITVPPPRKLQIDPPKTPERNINPVLIYTRLAANPNDQFIKQSQEQLEKMKIDQLISSREQMQQILKDNNNATWWESVCSISSYMLTAISIATGVSLIASGNIIPGSLILGSSTAFVAAKALNEFDSFPKLAASLTILGSLMAFGGGTYGFATTNQTVDFAKQISLIAIGLVSSSAKTMQIIHDMKSSKHEEDLSKTQTEQSVIKQLEKNTNSSFHHSYQNFIDEIRQLIIRALEQINLNKQIAADMRG